MNSKKMILAALTAGLMALLGAAQIHAQSSAFQFFGPLGRVITPNGDGVNDRFFVCFDNFADSGVSGRIYTLLGAEVAAMTYVTAANAGCASGLKPQFVSWDGRTTEGSVRSGLYVYRIEAEGKTYSGTFLVAR